MAAGESDLLDLTVSDEELRVPSLLLIDVYSFRCRRNLMLERMDVFSLTRRTQVIPLTWSQL